MPPATPNYSIIKGLKKGLGFVALTAASAACVSLANQEVWSQVLQAPNLVFLIPILAGAFRVLSNYLKVKYLG